MRPTRSSVLFALVAPAFVSGCFALFSLDEYGPNRGTGDGGASDDSGGGDGEVTTDAGASDAAKSPRIMFVTSARYNGSMGGIGGADNRCTAAANDAGLAGAYVAWLANGTNGPAARIADPQRAIVAAGAKTPIAAGMAELAATGPRSPLLVTESGDALTAAECADDRVWTNATAAGASAEPSLDCSSWSATMGGGNAGQLGGAHDEWTDGCPQQPCAIDGHLYCVQK